jgi:hypothetical protein
MNITPQDCEEEDAIIYDPMTDSQQKLYSEPEHTKMCNSATLTNTFDASKFSVSGSSALAGYSDAVVQEIQRYEITEDISTVRPIQDLRGADDMLIRYCSTARICTDSGTVFASRHLANRVDEREDFLSLFPSDLPRADDAFLRIFHATPRIPKSLYSPSPQRSNFKLLLQDSFGV